MVAAALLAAANAAVAAEDPAAPAPDAPKEDAIAGAKRDFQAVKSARDPALQPGGNLPRITVPELQTRAPEPGPWTQRKTTPTPERKSANWLVDAMEKKPDARGERAREKTGRERTMDLRGKDAAEPGAEDLKPRHQDEPAIERERREDPAALNPLTRYLGDWMTPQDYALLKPGLQQAMASGEPLSGAALSPFRANGLPSPLPGTDTAFGLLPPNQPAFVPPAPRENPYLQSLNSAPAPASGFAPPPGIAPPRSLPPNAAAPPSSAPPQTASPQSKVPEFARPGSDAKHFKPLKRF